MPKIEIDIDVVTNEALSSLAGARGTTPADLVAEIVGNYVQIPASEPHSEPLDSLVGSIETHADDYPAPSDAIDAIVGRYRGERINNIDEVVYGR
jgi:hypothetical protein